MKNIILLLNIFPTESQDHERVTILVYQDFTMKILYMCSGTQTVTASLLNYRFLVSIS